MKRLPLGRRQTVDILKILSIDLDDGDRILGGLIRLDGRYLSWNHYIKKVLRLAKNEKEAKFIWYLVGVKLGIMAERGQILMMPKQILDRISKKKEDRPEIE